MSPEAVSSFAARKIVVLGDVMLDRFVRGKVERVSPEAPIPVLLVREEMSMLGGAANVARNITSLGGTAVLIGVVGNDEAAAILNRMTGEEPGLSADFVVCATTPTIQKVRYVADQQQILRTDFESPLPDLQLPLEQALLRNLDGADALILSDYAKGVLTPELLRRVIELAHQAGIPVVVDPKNIDLTRYDGATLLTPNRHEAALATGISDDGDDSTAAAASAILEKLPRTQAVLVTRGAKGMTLAQTGGGVRHSPARAKEVFDVSGAGDTVVATLALALSSGWPLEQAVDLANIAAGIVVGKHGTATVTARELQQTFDGMGSPVGHKIANSVDAAAMAAQWQRQGKSVGFTNGCFDLIHPGHISLLSQARGQCDRLIVGLNSDASVKRLKGETRPIQNEEARAIVLASLAAVDLVVVFDEDTPLSLIEAIRPNVLIKGKDYNVETVVGSHFVQNYGGRIFLADLEIGQSTTNTIARMARPTP